MRPALLTGSILLTTLGGAVPVCGDDGSPAYPPTRRVDQVDRYHGTEVADPYRWLEADIRQSKEVTAWVRAQNAVTAKCLGTHPERSAVRKRRR